MANDESTKPRRKRSTKDAVEGFVSDLVDALKDLVNPEPQPVLVPIPVRQRPRSRRY